MAGPKAFAPKKCRYSTVLDAWLGSSAREEKRQARGSNSAVFRIVPGRAALALVVIHPFAQFLTCLEVRDVLTRYLHLLAGLGIAAGAWRPVVQTETTEAADLDAVTGGERVRHGIQHRLH